MPKNEAETRYELIDPVLRDKGYRMPYIKLDHPSASLLFQPDSPAYPEFRYYQDAAIRAAFEKIIQSEDKGEAPRVLLSLATGAGKTIIAANLLWRLHESLRLPKPALFLCDRDELREPAYEYSLIQAQEDGYLAACEILKRKATIDSRLFTKEEVLAAKPTNIKTGQPVTEADLTKVEYTGKDFDDELFIDMRTPAMCADLFKLLCENGGPEQKVIIFCTREIHADRVAMRMNNLYTRWCRDNQRDPKDHYAFKCMGGANNGADMIEPMRGSGERAFVACTVDLLEAGVDIERLNAVVFFRYMKSAIKFYQMVGRGTRIHEETQKYKFWLYDYTGVTDLFGTDFITPPPRPSGGGGYGPGGDGPTGPDIIHEAPIVPEIPGKTLIIPQGRFILSRRDGRDVPVPVEEYRREMIQRVLSDAHDLDEFRQLWIESQKRRKLIDHLLGDNFSPELIREIDRMLDYDIYDLFAHHGYRGRALKRPERKIVYLEGNQPWFDAMDASAATVLRCLGHQFERGGTEALETPALWDVPEIKMAGGLDALRKLGTPVAVMKDAKTRLFAE